MADGELESHFLRISRARNEGKPFHELMQTVIDFLTAKPSTYANGRRDEFLKRALDSMTRFAVLQHTGRRTPAAERNRAMGILTELLSSLDAAVPKPPIVDKAARVVDMLQLARDKYEKRQAAHRKERLSRGLSERPAPRPPTPES